MNIEFTIPAKGDDGQILDLFSKNDPERAALFTAEYYEWQFIRIPGGPAKQLVAKDNGIVVGFGALLPFKIKNNGKIETVYEGAEFVVAPTNRGRGLFTRLASKLYEDIGQSGSFAFASSMSFKIYQERLNHKFIGYFPYWIGIVDITQLLRRKIGFLALFMKPLINKIELNKFDANTNIVITPIKEFDEQWDTVETWTYNKQFYFQKSRQYLNWRYCLHPSNKYDVFGAFLNGKPKGFLVIRECNLVDIGYVDMEIFRALINAAIDFFRNNNILFSHSYLCLDKPACDILKRNGFRRANIFQGKLLKRYFYPRQRMLLYGKTLARLNFDSCMLTMGDIDTKL